MQSNQGQEGKVESTHVSLPNERQFAEWGAGKVGDGECEEFNPTTTTCEKLGVEVSFVVKHEHFIVACY